VVAANEVYGRVEGCPEGAEHLGPPPARVAEAQEIRLGGVGGEVAIGRGVEPVAVGVRPQVAALDEEIEAPAQVSLPGGERGEGQEGPAMDIPDEADQHLLRPT
jgi:hypothetical protein